jgi:membrane protein required for colicin V production
MLEHILWVDYFIIAIIVLSMLIGLWRGFLKEAIALATWVVAFILAFTFVEDAAAYLANYIGIPSIRIILAFGALFLSTLILGGLVNILVAQIVQHTGLTGTDRLLGIVFGLLRGVALITVLVLLAGLTPLPKDPWWSQSLFLPHFQNAALWLRNFLPPTFAEYVQFPERDVP